LPLGTFTQSLFLRNWKAALIAENAAVSTIENTGVKLHFYGIGCGDSPLLLICTNVPFDPSIMRRCGMVAIEAKTKHEWGHPTG
jgi:hypothetical protein